MNTFVFVLGVLAAFFSGILFGSTLFSNCAEVLKPPVLDPNTLNRVQSEEQQVLFSREVVTTKQDCHNELHTAFNAMESRGELPDMLNDLGLTGEGVEVGVRKGDFSKHILSKWRGRKIHCVDPWEHQDEKLYKDISNRDQTHQDSLYDDLDIFMKENYPSRHELHRGYSVDKATEFPDNFFDFVYLDARHDYEGVKEDLNAWWGKLKVGGVFAGHDFVPDGNIKAGLFGVQKAVHEFAKTNKREFLSISTKDADGGRSEPQWVDGGWTTWYLIK